MIRCTNCGAEMPIGTKFCAACGAAMPEYAEQPSAPVPMKKAFDVKKLLIPVVGALALVVILILAVNLFSSDKYTYEKGFTFVMSEGDGTVLVIPSGKSKQSINGYLNDTLHSMDGTIVAVTVSGSLSSREGYDLYLVTDKPKRISENVYQMFLSANGKAVAYTKESEDNPDAQELWLYNGSKSTLITEDYYSNCVISPDGKTLSYVSRTVTSSATRDIAYIWNGKENELGRDLIPIAIANGAKYTYFYRNASLYVQRGLNTERREKLGDSVNNIYANANLSQLVFNADGRARISRNGGSPESLTGTVNGFLLPDTVAIMPNPTAGDSGSLRILGVSGFGDTFYYNNSGSSNSIVRINKKFETEGSVASRVTTANIARDGKTITYIRDGRLERVNGLASNPEAVRLVENDVTYFRATNNGKAAFYVIDGNEIYYIKGTGKPATVTNDFYRSGSYSDSFVLYNGSRLFYISEGELYTSTGGKGSLVRNLKGDTAEGIKSVGSTLFAGTTDGSSNYLYLSKNGKKFDLMWND